MTTTSRTQWQNKEVCGAPERPRIVCLCGSTRFFKTFQKTNFSETLAGRIVLTIGCDSHDGALKISAGTKKDLDELHKRKIDLADEILVLNVGGYIGESTRSEIEYAKAHRKPIRWLEPAPHDQNPARYEQAE